MSEMGGMQIASSQLDASLVGMEAGDSRARAPRLTVSQQRELMSQKSGDRRTIYWTKVSKGGAYQTTGTYLGQWQGNKKHGKGTQTWANGDKYVGEWADGKPAGFGTFWKREPGKQKLVKQFAGQWLNGQQHGRGVHYYEDGSVYDGHWRNGLRSGVGIMSYADGSVYEGSWFNDKRHGFGVVDHVNGDHFEGHYVEDKREGEGVLFFFSAAKKTHHKRMDGEWVDDVCKTSIYSEMEPDPNVPASFQPEPLPKLQLADPDGVAAAELRRIREQRAHHRADRVTVDEKFTPEELEALREAFARVDPEGHGFVNLLKLREAFAHIGMEPTNEDMEAVMTDVFAQPSGVPLEHHANSAFTFADFAQACDFLSPVE